MSKEKCELKDNNFAIKTSEVCQKCTPYILYDEKMQELEQQLQIANAEIKSLTEIKDFESDMRIEAELKLQAAKEENERLKAQLEVFLRLSDIKVAVKLQREKNMLVEALKTISKMDITEDYYSIDEQPCIVAINALEELAGWNEQ